MRGDIAMPLTIVHGMLWATLLGLLPASAPPRLTLGDLAFLAGRWTGTLEYLDYTDNRTRQTLQARLDCTPGDDAIAYRYSYVEPNGEAVRGDDVRLTLDDQGTRLRLNEEQWRVIGRAVSSGRVEIVLSRDGTDAEKPALFRRTIRFDGVTLVILTEVNPQGGEGWFVRNAHVLTRDGLPPGAR